MKLIKKLLSSVMAIACGVSVMCGDWGLLTAGADDTYGVLTYDIIDEDEDGTYDYVRITDCDESVVSVDIPVEINGLPVESIGFEAFANCKNLESITIPDSVTSIVYDAFSDTALVNNQTGVKYADKWVVECDTDVKSAKIKAGTRGIANCAFTDCTSLESITLPDGVKSIGNSAFSYCTSLKSITIPDSVASIGYGAFFNTALVNSQIGVKYADKWVVDCDEDVVSAEIKTDTMAIASFAFSDCTSLESITIPVGVTSIGGSAFSFCKSLKSITIPAGVTSIGNSTFSNCKSLKSVTIPDSIISIGMYAFTECTSLESITLSDSVTSMGWGAFSNCTSLKSITLPDSITSIVSYAFDGCTSLESITLPDSITSIGIYAFVGCTSLSSITIPYSVTSMDNGAFSKCTGLESITVLNPDCGIDMRNRTICNDYDNDNNAYYKGTIYGDANSTAQTYADKYNYKFLAINNYGVLGDADGDGKVTAKDSSLVFSEFKRIYRSEPSTFTEQQMKRCDLNGDGKITAIDASKVFSIYKENYRRG